MIEESRTPASSGNSDIVSKPDWEGFAKAIMGYSEWPDGGLEMDGYTFQETATMYGLLIPTEMERPCGEHCKCLEYLCEVDFPTTCYRRAY